MWLGGLTSVILLLALTSCARSPRTAQAPSSANPPAPPASTTVPAASSRAAAPPPTPAAAAAPNAAAAAVPSPAAAPSQPGPAARTITLAQEQLPSAPAVAARQNTDVSSLLPLGRAARVLPEDFKIGVLADARVGDAEEQQAMTAASSFLSRLVAGKVDASLLDPETGGRVSDMLGFGLERGDLPRAYRVGTPKKHESGEVTANVRLFGPEGTSEGEIALSRTGGRWLVKDLQISMDDLQVKTEKPKERFFPSSYRWMLEE